MKVSEYFEAAVPGYPVQSLGSVMKSAAFSPVLASPALIPLNLDDDISDHLEDAVWMKSLDYALSSLYYSMSGVFSGGSRSEQVGDVRASLSGFTITQSDRKLFIEKANEIRVKLGYKTEKVLYDSGGMFDASPLRRR